MKNEVIRGVSLAQKPTNVFQRILTAILWADARYRENLHFARLSDAELRDIGLSPAERDRMIGRPIWDPPVQLSSTQSVR